MIQIYGKTFLSMEFKSIIKTHDLKPWRFIYPKPNFHWQYQSSVLAGNILNPILIGNIKTQFSLAISKAQLTLALLKAQANYLALFY